MGEVRILNSENRDVLTRLVNDRLVSDAMAAYYALNHPSGHVQLFTYESGNGSPIGFLVNARTGVDLFRPLAIPFVGKAEPLQELLRAGLRPGRPVLLSIPVGQRPWAEEAVELSEIHIADSLRLDPTQLQPVINVLLVESRAAGGWPRFEIHSQQQVQAAAGLNWVGGHYAEVYVEVQPPARERRFGISVLSAMVNRLLEERKVALLQVEEGDSYTLQDALELGFRMTGTRILTAQAVLKE